MLCYLQAMEIQRKAGIIASSANELGGTMKSLTQAQEATGKAHITIQVFLLHFNCAYQYFKLISFLCLTGWNEFFQYVDSSTCSKYCKE